MIPGHLLLANRVRDELLELERSVDRAHRAWGAAELAQSNQSFLVDSAALSLHGFYAGMERLLEHITHQLDGGPPKGSSWHKELLRQISMDVPGVRPPVLSQHTITSLDEFRRFRHVVRNIYAEYLEPERVGKLITQLANVWPQIQTELKAFAAFLEGVSKADDAL
jgi:hypothetical protein